MGAKRRLNGVNKTGQTDKQTYGHRDSMTELAQWADSVKIYDKQKEGHFKGDWIELLKTYFEFMEIDINEQEITGTHKDSYRKKIKDLIRKAAFKELTEMKNSKSKIQNQRISL